MNKQQLIDFANSRTLDENFHYHSYEDYVKWQTVTGQSRDFAVQRRIDGQRRFIDIMFKDIDTSSRILDVSCGDGIGLTRMKELGFNNILGADINDTKIETAKGSCDVIKHDLCSDEFDSKYNKSFDVVYSSHSLEHVLNPIYSIGNLYKVLKDKGEFILVLPYVDFKAGTTQVKNSFMIHCGSIPLGLHIRDEGETLIKNIESVGFQLNSKKLDNFREPEIWLSFKK